jgi:hypothetical protein
MRTILTALATTLMFFSGTLCDGIAFELDSETVAQLSEESESDSRIKCLSSKRYGLKAKDEEIVKRIGNKTFEDLRTKKKLLNAKLREMDYCYAEWRQVPEKKKTDTGNVREKAIEGRTPPTAQDAVIIDDDLRVSHIHAVQTGCAPDSVNNQSVYKITMGVENKGVRGKVMILLAGKGRDGREIGTVMLKDVLDENESKTLTATASLTSVTSREINSWEVFRAHKYIDTLTG